MKYYKILTLFLLLWIGIIPSQAMENDTLFMTPDTLGTQYTLSLSGIQLKNQDSSFGLLIRRPYGNSSSRCIWTEFFRDCIKVNGNIVASGLNDTEKVHDYLIIRGSSSVNLYRDGILLATLPESNSSPFQSSQASLKFESTLTGCNNLSEGYSASILSCITSQEVDEAILENHITEMLPVPFKNMVNDPYMNHGFSNTGLGAQTRTLYSNAASWGGWGSEATTLYEGAYSGNSCVKISGQAYNNGTTTSGASLDLPLTLTSGTSYLVRAMVKSDGYIGKIAIEGENGYIPITDTQNEWKQIEGILSCTASRKMLYINNYDFINSGTLYIDNVEVYKCFTSTNVGYNNPYVPYLELAKGKKYVSATERELYMAGFQLEKGSCSELDLKNLNYHGAARITREIEGSKLYAISLPGDLSIITVTGKYDGNTYTDKPLFNGLDYILQKYEYPYFNYCPTDQNITAGYYLIQFVDNLEGLKISMTMGKKKEIEKTNNTYYLAGNPTFTKYTPEGKFLKFNEDSQRFDLTENEEINPFEAYIATSVSVPVDVIYPQQATDFKQIQSNDGNKISLYTVDGGVILYSLENTIIDVYSASAEKIATWEVTDGENFKPLPRGFYLIGGKKVIISH